MVHLCFLSFLLFNSLHMMEHHNHLGQPIGFPVANREPPPWPPRLPLPGRYCRLEPLEPERHAADLFAANLLDRDGQNWTYLAYGPFDCIDDYLAWITATCLGNDPLFFAIVDLGTGKATGVASYLRINPSSGSIEVGHLNYSPLLQRTAAATEAMFLMMRQAFELGYRRYEWKCNALNAKSRAAAQRLGFSFEGVFRQAAVVKGHNRDTAWYAAIDSEWPLLQEAFTRWLDPANFDEAGRQRLRLSELTGPILKRRG
jgi:RimJ/RimL family protein N-acetyltransferase